MGQLQGINGALEITKFSIWTDVIGIQFYTNAEHLKKTGLQKIYYQIKFNEKAPLRLHAIGAE